MLYLLAQNLDLTSQVRYLVDSIEITLAQAAFFLWSAVFIKRLDSRPGILRLPIWNLRHLAIPCLSQTCTVLGAHPGHIPRLLRAVAALQAVLNSKQALIFVRASLAAVTLAREVESVSSEIWMGPLAGPLYAFSRWRFRN